MLVKSIYKKTSLNCWGSKNHALDYVIWSNLIFLNQICILTQSIWLKDQACETGTLNQHLPVYHGLQVQEYRCIVRYLLWINLYFELTNIKLMRFYSIIVHAFCMVVEYSTIHWDKNIHFKCACLKIRCKRRNKRGELHKNGK